MEGGALRATVHGVSRESNTAERLSLFTAITTVRVTIPVITTVLVLVALTLCHEMDETFTHIISFNLYNGPFV